MHQDIQRAEAAGSLLRHALDFLVTGHIARLDERAARGCQQRQGMFLHRRVIAETQRGALGAEGLGDAPGDAALVGYPKDQGFFTG